MTPLRSSSFCLAIAIAGALQAQTPYARPQQVPAGLFPGEQHPPTGPQGLPGATFSPDGRLLLFAHWPWGQAPFNAQGWLVSSFLPESVTAAANGTAHFAAQATDVGPWSSAIAVEANVSPPAVGQYPIAKQQFVKQWMSMCPDPSFAHWPCPFPLEQAGVPHLPAAALVYQMRVFAADWWGPTVPGQAWGVHTFLGNPWTRPVFHPFAGVTVHPIGMRSLRVEVLPGGNISSVSISHDFEILEWTHPTLGAQPILGIEPSISRDGRLLVFHGNVANQGRVWNAASTNIHQILYSFNETPGAITGWSMPRPISDMYATETAPPAPAQPRLVNGVPFADLYPIARAPFRMADGSALSMPLQGAYPWMTIDGTDLVFSATRRGDIPGERRDRGISIVGASTGFCVRHIDGPLNPDRDTTDRVITTGTGAVPGIWAWGGDTPGLKLPYNRLGSSIPLLSAQTREYAEISVHESTDGDYLLAWDMNEFMAEDAILGWQLDARRTPDSSGSCISGMVTGDASFPTANSMGGITGQMVLSAGAGHVEASHPSLNAGSMEITVEGWFAAPVTNNEPFSVLRKAGSFAIEANPLGQVRATLQTTGGTTQTGWLAAPLTTIWRHAAFSWNGALGRFRVYVDGVVAHEVSMAPGLVIGTQSALLAGPASLVIGTAAPAGIFGIDQVRISRVERTADEMARAAFTTPAASVLVPLPTAFLLPLGLDHAETKVPLSDPLVHPTHPATRAKIDLGEALFHDKFLSTNGRSCATCHIDTPPTMSFTDGIAQRPGFATGVPLRNAPTTLNRLFSTAQFLDGHALTLEDQVLEPLTSPEEMGANLTAVDQYLNLHPTYPAQFALAFAGAQPSVRLLQRAIAAYERALVAGNSPADQFEAGLTNLTHSERNGYFLFFGKARCFGCHSGSNYSDERFHVTVVAGQDEGRALATGRSRDMHRFKTPTLRNLANTAPYFHRGQAATLADVITAYDVGGNPAAVDEEIRPLGLTPTEKVDLAAFLLTLSGGWQKL